MATLLIQSPLALPLGVGQANRPTYIYNAQASTHGKLSNKSECAIAGFSHRYPVYIKAECLEESDLEGLRTDIKRSKPKADGHDAHYRAC